MGRDLPFFEEERDFFRNWFSHHPWELVHSLLPTDIYEKEGIIVVESHVPGINNEDIVVELLSNNRLRITGSRKNKEEVKKADYYKKEIKSGAFEQIIVLPCEVEADSIAASVEHGVLHIELPKKKCEKGIVKKVTVHTR